MSEIKDFILDYPNFLTPEECQGYIEYYDKMQDAGFVYDRQETDNTDESYVSGTSLYVHDINSLRVHNTGPVSRHFIKKFWETAYPLYTKKFSVINNSYRHKIYHLKIQKNEPGEAYHVWHYETQGKDNCFRILNFICYLNTVEEGGETEFLYYPKRIKPEVGKLLVMPAGFTHTHRGNQPFNKNKYIITGWVEFE